MSSRWGVRIGVGACALMVAACGGSGEPAVPEAEAAAPQAEVPAEAEVLASGLTAAEQIALRQDRFEELGDTFRTINQQLRLTEPDVTLIQASAAKVPTLTEGMETWFPEGTGPESGIETEALATIWETPEDFAQKVADHRAAATALAETATGGDLAAIAAAVQATGKTCGACHDVYRVDD